MSSLQGKQGNVSHLIQSAVFFFIKTHMKCQTSLQWETTLQFKKNWQIFQIYRKLLDTVRVLIFAVTTKTNNYTNNDNNNSSVFACVCDRSLYWGCRLKSRQVQGCLYLVGVVCCEAEFSPLDWPFIQRSPTECGVSECDREASIMGKPWPTWDWCAVGEKHTAVLLYGVMLLRLVVLLLGAVEKLRKVTVSFTMSVCLTVGPHRTTRLQLEGFGRIFILDFFKLSRNFEIYQIWQEYRYFTWKSIQISDNISLNSSSSNKKRFGQNV
jgi:hypothetical protein